MNVPNADAPASEWLVYADALQQKGEPLGEFIALLNSGDAAKRDAWLQKNGTALLGADLAGALGQTLSLEWKWGFIEKATVKASSAETIGSVVTTLLVHPRAERLKTLAVVAVPGADDAVIDLTSLVGRIGAEKTPPALELIDDRAANCSTLTSRDFDPGNNLVNFGPLNSLWKSLRSLKLVVADVRQLTFGEVNAPELESLTIHGLRLAAQAYGDNEPCEVADALGQAKLPKLKNFEMRLNEEWTVNHIDDTDSYTTHDSFPEDEFDDGYSDGANWEAEFGAALANLTRSPLERLALTNFASTESFLRLLGQNVLPATLRELDLSESSLSGGDLPWFTQHEKQLSKIKKLVVKETGITEEDATKLKKIFESVESSAQAPRARPEWQSEEEAAEEGGTEAPLPKYRYTVGME
jgi:hypothetical protein